MAQRIFAIVAGSCALSLAVVTAPALPGAIVITEIHYNPPVSEANLEFVEISNDSPTPQDISGWEFTEGIEFLFPQGTLLLGNGILVVCADAEAVRARYGVDNAIGNFEGRLSAAGERLTVVNHSGIVVQSVRYQDDGKWPVGPDGTGHSLVLRGVRLDPKEPESWDQSPEVGGSPGRVNFPPPDAFVETVLIDAEVEWRFARGFQAFSDPPGAWSQPEFDDAGWEVGTSGFGIGDDDDSTVLEDMQGNYSSVAVRKRFVLETEDIEGPGRLFLGMTFDDGFCAWLNGEEIARVNCPDDPTWNQVATRPHEARREEAFPIPPEHVRVGENVLAIVGFNRSLRGNDFSLLPRLLHRQPPQFEGAGQFRGPFNELYRSDEPGDSWVELYNPDPVAYELGGLRVTDDPDRSDPYVFPDGARIMPGGFLVLRARETGLELSGVKVRVFLLSETGFVLSAAAFDQELPGALPAVGFSDARFPDGGRPGWLTRTPTPAAPNEVARLTDLVINEIFYQPPEDRRGEFLELYHRGTEPLDISGFRFTKGIAYTFPEGTVVQPGEYVVLTEDPGILLENHGVDAHRYEGQLADGGENIRLVDRLGNVVDEVRYHDGGEWSRWSDGDGSSLELIDPRQENDFPTAWTDSDESEKTRWEELSYEVPRYSPAGESELHLFLAGKGVCRIDDVAVIRESDGSNLVANSGFEEDTRPWRIEGTHVDSHRITSDRHSGEACLELVATGKGDSGCNRLETDVARLGRESLTVSLWARWLRGASLLIAHGEFAAGRWPGTRDVNLSNNSLGRRLRLTVPVDLGTPGRENSARALLRETGDDNLGPVMADARHVPTSPAAGEPVTVVARIADADGVERAEILYKLDDGTLEGFQSAELFDDGAHEDGRPGDGLYGGTIPGFPLRSHVIYTIQATDTAGATGRLPSRAPEESFVYAVEGRLAEQIQVVLDRASDRELRTRRLHSNDLVDGTFVYDGEDVYYNVGLRYRGSPWGRPQMQSYRVTFPKDRLLHRNRRQINISNRDRNDGLAYFLIGRNGTTRTPAPVSDYEYIRTRVNGRSFGTPGVFNPVNRDFVEMWYGDEAADGAVVLKAVGRLRFSDACQRTGWDEAHLQHMETNPENYRFYWFHSIHQSRDNWEPFYELTRLLDRRHTADAEFDRRVAEVVDLDAFFQVLGPRILMSDGDALFVGNGHNGYVLWDPTDRRWKLLAFDFGGAFRNSGANILGVRDAGVRRLLTRPVSQRVYFRTLLESLEGYWSVEKAGPWLEAMQRAAGLGASVRSFLASSSRAAQSALRRHVQVEFRILTNDGMDFTHPEPSVELEGESPIQVAWIFFRRGDGEFELLEPTWTRATRWRATFDVPADANRFEFVGIGGDGDEIASASIAVLRNASFLRGDATGDGRLNVSDPVATLFFLFRGRALRCPDAADVDDSGDVNLTDAVRLLSFLFRGGPPPQEPFPVAGADPTEDELSCQDG